MDIEAEHRKTLISYLENEFECIEECNLNLVGFDFALRADIVAISKNTENPWVLAFEVKIPNDKWELKHWLNVFRQAGNYPNCRLCDNRAGRTKGKLINASFIFPEPNLGDWGDEDSQSTRYYRSYDQEPLRGAKFLAQHFKAGITSIEPQRKRLRLILGTDTVWDNQKGFSAKSESLLSTRKIGSRTIPLK